MSMLTFLSRRGREKTVKLFNLRLKQFFLLLSLMTLSACSKTVEWEEEVPLNTGQTIWVKRSVVYSLQGESGNPLKIDYRPNSIETLSFEWNGKKYIYEGDAALMLLAISPSKQPILVAPAADRSWDWNHSYHCTTPHYVQFTPSVSGREWSWPPEIESWLYGMSHNLMRKRLKPEAMQMRYTAEQRIEEDRILSIQTPSRVIIDSKHISNNCKNKTGN